MGDQVGTWWVEERFVETWGFTMEAGNVVEEKPLVIPPIHQSIASTDPKDYLTVTQRYYTPLYHLDPDREKREDLLILCHSNKICLVALVPSHPIVKDNLVIDKVNLDVSKNIDRKSNKTSGKSKKGGQALQDDSILVILETETKKYKVKAIVPGKLICINKVITEDSQKIVTHHDSLGHIAILLPTKGQYEAAKAKLLSQEEYAKRIREEEAGADN